MEIYLNLGQQKRSGITFKHRQFVAFNINLDEINSIYPFGGAYLVKAFGLKTVVSGKTY
jgi:hypothetical protein